MRTTSLPCCEAYTVDCPSCGLRDWNGSGRVRATRLSRCGNCGLLGTTHFLDGTKSTDLLYEANAQDFREYRERYLQSRLEVYRRFLPGIDKFRDGNRLLEVGAGYGYFVEFAARAGWAAEGIEISRYSCEVARSRGSNVQHGELRDVAASNPPYDVIVMWDVIEHFTQPREVISMCRNLLRKGGALVMRTPNGQALGRSRAPGRVAYRNLAYPANTAEHVFHFRPEELNSIVEQVGFETVDVNCIGEWKEYVIPGNNSVVIAGRWLVLRYAYRRGWPYEFVLTAIRK
jgi:2-polyprenyl-3-methyl-5-hydroxy-6-metoxy-1,4-benzoquinol methylase